MSILIRRPNIVTPASSALELPAGLDLYDDFSEYSVGTWADQAGGAGNWNGVWGDLGTSGEIEEWTFDGTETKNVMELNATRLGRKFTKTPADWTTIRIGFRYMIDHNSNATMSGTDFAYGIASGITDIYPPTTSLTHALVINQTPGGLSDGAEVGNGRRRFTSSGTPYHQYRKMVSTTDSGLGQNTASGPRMAKADSLAVSLPWATGHFFEFTKATVDGSGLGTSWDIEHTFDRSASAGDRLHCTKTDLVTAMNETSMTDVETYMQTSISPNYQRYADTGNSVDESVDGEFDAITFSWDQSGANKGLFLLDVGVRFIA